MTKSKIRIEIARYLVLAIASAIMAVDYRTFVEWGGLYPGGAAGVAILTQRLMQMAFDHFGISFSVPFGPINLLWNAIPVWIGFKYIGTRFTLQSLYVIFLSGFFTDLVPIEWITSMIDPSDLILGLNAAILICAGFMFGWRGALYSIIYQFIYIQVIHLMYRTYQYQTLLIVTSKPAKICEAIYRFSHHGATVLEGKGGFKGEPRQIVMSVVSADNTPHIYALCKTLDPTAFINTLSTSRVIGRFYLRPRD